ncbi:MAG: ribonuclease III domain-containing protein, partial [Clostridia bacterium]
MIETHSNDYTNAELTDFCNKIYKCHFSGKSMIFQAFTHSSYANDHRIGDNERLEFLGDSVLGFTVATYLYKTYPLKNEGTYSKIKSNVVSTESLAEITEKLGLHNYLKYNSNSIKCGNPKKLHAN